MVWRRILPDPEKNQVIRVEKGERLYFDLAEDVDAGILWDCTCDDADVEVTIDHETPGERKTGTAAVRIRIHRGYDGPSTIRFVCRSPNVAEPVRTFTLSLFRRTGDCAFWK